MLDAQVTFDPTEEQFDAPAQSVNRRPVFSFDFLSVAYLSYVRK